MNKDIAKEVNEILDDFYGEIEFECNKTEDRYWDLFHKGIETGKEFDYLEGYKAALNFVLNYKLMYMACEDEEDD